jgi:hypothetical protein
MCFEMSQKEWELGGLTDTDGNLGRPVPSGYVLVPGKIELVGDALHWEHGGEGRKVVEISRSTLNEFVTLWRQSPQAIQRFARRWGVLSMRCTSSKEGGFYVPCGENMPIGADPIDAWRYFSRRAFAVLNIAAALNRNRGGDMDDWRVIADADQSTAMVAAQHRYGFGWLAFDKQPKDHLALGWGRTRIAYEIQIWLSSWKARRARGVSDFAVEWNSRRGRWELRIDYNGFLFAAIAFQLALCIVGADTLYMCSGCGDPYTREVKRPKPGTANYCLTCSKKGVAKRRAVDAYRSRKSQAVELRSAGVPLAEIASKMKKPLSRISKWCEAIGPEPLTETRASDLRSKKRGGGRKR